MSVKAQRGGLVGEDGAMDRFPVGMRVLAVDDNPICLRLLEGLLQNCQYQGLFLLLALFFPWRNLHLVFFKF